MPQSEIDTPKFTHPVRTKKNSAEKKLHGNKGVPSVTCEYIRNPLKNTFMTTDLFCQNMECAVEQE